MTSKRTISALNETALLQSNVKTVLFVRLDFASGVQRWHTEIGPRTAVHPIYGAETYTGIGDFGGLSSDIIESVSGAPQPLTMSLTGLDSSLINTALTDDYFRRDAEILLGLEDAAGDLIDDPIVLYSGYMDKVDVALQEGSGQISLNLESRGTQFLSASDLRFTDEDLQVAYPGDLIGEYIYRMYDLVLHWGGANTAWALGGGRDTPSPGNRRGYR